MASTLGAHNPLRYRGYVYDTETGLYYLQSRYYSPQVGRFLNADVFVSTGQGLLSNNIFAYCLNNPVMFKDVNGQSVTAAIAAGLKISADALNAILLVCLVVVIVTNPQVQQWAETQRKIIEDKLVDVLTRAIPPKNEKYHIHHIVAQKDTRAEPARQILALVHIDVNSLVNKIPVKESVHRHLHTTAYFNWVNVQVMTAYWESEPNSLQQYENVVETLLYLQMQILAWNAISP